jgi:small basic protein
MMTYPYFLQRWIPTCLLVLLISLGTLYALGLPDDAWLLFAVLWVLYAGLGAVVVRGSLRAMDAKRFDAFQLWFVGGLMGKILLTGLCIGLYAWTSEEKTSAVLIPLGLTYVPLLLLETGLLTQASRERSTYKGGSGKRTGQD